MPTIAWAHSQYWSGAAGGPAPVGAAVMPIYPRFQTTHFSGFAVLQIVWEWAVTYRMGKL